MSGYPGLGANRSYGEVIVSIGPLDGGLGVSCLSGVAIFLCKQNPYQYTLQRWDYGYNIPLVLLLSPFPHAPFLPAYVVALHACELALNQARA